MDAPLAVATVVEKLGALVMVLAAAGAVALPRPRWRAAALVTAVAVAPWLLIEAVRDVRRSVTRSTAPDWPPGRWAAWP